MSERQELSLQSWLSDQLLRRRNCTHGSAIAGRPAGAARRAGRQAQTFFLRVLSLIRIESGQAESYKVHRARVEPRSPAWRVEHRRGMAWHIEPRGFYQGGCCIF